MDLETRKYHFIKELLSIDRESVLDALEQVLKTEKEEQQELSKFKKQQLDERLESYKKNPEKVLDWETFKKEW